MHDVIGGIVAALLFWACQASAVVIVIDDQDGSPNFTGGLYADATTNQYFNGQAMIEARAGTSGTWTFSNLPSDPSIIGWNVYAYWYAQGNLTSNRYAVSNGGPTVDVDQTIAPQHDLELTRTNLVGQASFWFQRLTTGEPVAVTDGTLVVTGTVLPAEAPNVFFDAIAIESVHRPATSAVHQAD